MDNYNNKPGGYDVAGVEVNQLLEPNRKEVRCFVKVTLSVNYSFWWRFVVVQ